MALPEAWRGRLALPVIAAPMFLISTPAQVIACCRNGVAGTFPALNQRSTEGYADWLAEVSEALGPQDAPFGVNLVVHGSNARLEADLAATVTHRVPLVVTSLGVDPAVIEAVHAYGGLVFHDVTNRRFAERAIAAGVDGLIAVSQGAGGHAGAINPFAILTELRAVFDGPLVLGGALSTGAQVAAAQMAGADLAYLGTRFLATKETSALQGHLDMIVAGHAEDIALSPGVSGIPANFLRASLSAAGIDPDSGEPPAERNFGTTGNLKPWRDIWAAGQGIGAIRDVPATADLCAKLVAEYRAAIDGAATLAVGLR
ncbi:2-nitropropane dioxygenase (plasmid) [Sulfitobacter alexandrii]|uniref:2-nitropropane dioxygenase n=1 Tax=Sulfitobacter alexandrii TaxID=1917485 RepID=A0A1J0WNS4_9RHOB|nr:nitronate monooxygenase family protein [Sulfitobacter alexandrii]APE45975.1 2-nitropropane dioxygenase [Sulfitobacter alexandrii]